MDINVKVTSIFQCSLERAFKTPMLCDISKVHTGFGLIPAVTHCTDDQAWGQVGSTKKVFAAESFMQKGGFISIDKVIERIENRYWKIEVSNFQSWMLNFSRLTGEWQTTELEKNKILVEYTYTLHADIAILYPLNWLFAKTSWRTYMKRVLENVKQMAYIHESYRYD